MNLSFLSRAPPIAVEGGNILAFTSAEQRAAWPARFTRTLPSRPGNEAPTTSMVASAAMRHDVHQVPIAIGWMMIEHVDNGTKAGVGDRPGLRLG